jgi:ATP-dependent Lon protease
MSVFNRNSTPPIQEARQGFIQVKGLLLPTSVADQIAEDDALLGEAIMRDAIRDEAEEKLMRDYIASEPDSGTDTGYVAFVPPPAKPKRLIQVFDRNLLDIALKKAKTADRNIKPRLQADLDMANRFDGQRAIPQFRSLPRKMMSLVSRFPNFRHAIEGMTEDFALAAAGSYKRFRVSPVLLNGAPGIGKTCFAQAMAESLGVPFLKISAGGLQHPAQITGSAQYWSNSTSGQIFDILARNDSAVAVLLLDEVDKIRTDGQHNPIPAILDLLEPESSRRFKDESLLIEMDASRLVVLMTSNDKRDIDGAMISRVNTYDVSAPCVNQRLEIIKRIHAGLCAQTRRKLKLDSHAMNDLANCGNADLRAVYRAVRSAFARALLDGEKTVLPKPCDGDRRRKMGF